MTSHQVFDQCLPWRNSRTLYYVSQRSWHHLRNRLVTGPQSQSQLGKTVTSLDTLPHYLQIKHYPHDYWIMTPTSTPPNIGSIYHIRWHKGDYSPTRRNERGQFHTISSAIQGWFNYMSKNYSLYRNCSANRPKAIYWTYPRWISPICKGFWWGSLI